MKTFFVLCFTLCLEGSCKGMLVFNTFSLALLSKVSSVYMVEVLCNASGARMEFFFSFKLSEVRFRHSVTLGGSSALYPSTLFLQSEMC